MREVKIYVTIQYDDEKYDLHDDILGEKLNYFAESLGGEVIDLEIK